MCRGGSHKKRSEKAPREAVVYRERAYAGFRRDGELARAARIALWLSRESRRRTSQTADPLVVSAALSPFEAAEGTGDTRGGQS